MASVDFNGSLSFGYGNDFGGFGAEDLYQPGVDLNVGGGDTGLGFTDFGGARFDDYESPFNANGPLLEYGAPSFSFSDTFVPHESPFDVGDPFTFRGDGPLTSYTDPAPEGFNFDAGLGGTWDPDFSSLSFYTLPLMAGTAAVATADDWLGWEAGKALGDIGRSAWSTLQGWGSRAATFAEGLGPRLASGLLTAARFTPLGMMLFLEGDTPSGGDHFEQTPQRPPFYVSPADPPGFDRGEKEIFPTHESHWSDGLLTHPFYDGPVLSDYSFPVHQSDWRDSLTTFPGDLLGHWSDGIYLSENQRSGEHGSIDSYSTAVDWHQFVDRVFRGYYPEKELRTLDLSPAFTFDRTLENEKRFGPDYYLARIELHMSDKTYLDSQLRPDGRLDLRVRARNPAEEAYGSELFEGMMRKYWERGYDPKFIQGIWSREAGYSGNYWRFRNNLDRGLSPEDAARQTWTGRQAARFGYTTVDVPGDRVEWSYIVEPTFSRPDFGPDPAWNNYGWLWSRAIGFPR